MNHQTGVNEAYDLATFHPKRHLDGDTGLTLLPFGGGERVCLGKALAELEIRLMAIGLLGRLGLWLAPPEQDLALQPIRARAQQDGTLNPPASAPRPPPPGSRAGSPGHDGQKILE